MNFSIKGRCESQPQPEISENTLISHSNAHPQADRDEIGSKIIPTRKAQITSESEQAYKAKNSTGCKFPEIRLATKNDPKRPFPDKRVFTMDDSTVPAV
ncbi:MAG: hypothetical protein LBR91_02145 [Puniceicoccales bacterium]|nr:hypothetical protein [Puniceicoccales bacterium]